MNITRLCMFSLYTALIAANAFAGIIGGGGGGPPAREALEELLLSRDVGAAGLFETNVDGIKLGVNRPLDNQLILSKGTLQTTALRISDADFDRLNGSGLKTIDARAFGQGSQDLKADRSYLIEDGNSIGELILKDRREAIRSTIR